MLTSRFWAALVALALSASAGAVPTKLSSTSGEVRDIVFASGTTLYAATQGGGVFKSIDSGATWAATALNTGYVWRIAISHLAPTTTLYAATDTGLFRSANSGTSWTQLTFDPARAVAVDPNSGVSDTVLLGVPGEGILRSTDGGTTWTRQSTGLDSSEVTQIFIRTSPSGEAFVLLNCNSEDAIFPYEQGGWGGVFRTASLSATPIIWASYQSTGGGTALPTKCVRSIAGAASSARLLAGIQDPFDGTGAIWRTDGGVGGWTQAQDLFGIESLNGSAASATTFYAGTRGVGVYTSTDSGNTWAAKSNVSSDPELRNRSYAMASVAGNAAIVMASAKGLGIMRSTNFTGVTSWGVVGGLTADRVRALDNHRTAAAGTYWMGLEGGGVAKSTNSGATWASLLTGLDLGATGLDVMPTINAIAADPSATTTVLIGARPYGLLQLSGGTWVTTGLPASLISTTVPLSLPDYKPQSLGIPQSGLAFYTLFDSVSSVGGGLWRSTSGPSGLVQTNYPADILNCTLSTAQAAATKLVFTSSASYLLRHDSSMPYRSTDIFATNVSPCVTVTHEGYERVTFHDLVQRPPSGPINVAATSKGIFRSSDDGVTWARVNVSGLTSQVLCVYNGFAATCP